MSKADLIIIIGGEPYSVFSEILFKALKHKDIKKTRKKIILISSVKLIKEQMKKLNFNYKINVADKKLLNIIIDKKNTINMINVNFIHQKPFDKITTKSNLFIEDCFNTGLAIIKKNNCCGIITGPISKKHFLKKKFLGITEYMAERTDKKNKIAMLIYNKKLSVCPITTHLPLRDVHKEITRKKIITQTKLINNFYIKRFKKIPRIGVTGLNPHCESNYDTSEENRIISPAINYLKKEKYKISGPFPADTIFMKDNSKKFDVIIGMYHDQVLSPIKSLVGFEAINITLGLPFLRVSPDHGPNSIMLGKNLSNPKSLIECLKFFNN